MRTIPEVPKTDISISEGVVSLSQYRGYTTHQIFFPVEMFDLLVASVKFEIADELALIDAGRKADAESVEIKI